jgi:RNA polymerase sigma-70 factor (ECF subfamily)
MDRQTPAAPETRRQFRAPRGVVSRVTQDFATLTEPYRRELLVHSYRMLGSVQDAEDVLQETLLAAWRGLGDFEERSSLRTWLYRIATNRCLNWLRDSSRRPRAEPIATAEPAWLEPYPDALLDDLPDDAPGPEARYETKEAVTLAFIAALQRLPPLPRAVLVLRDVLGYRATEVAELLETTETAVNSALARARATAGARRPSRAPRPRSARERELVDRYARAFEAADVDGLVALLTGDALMTMPPQAVEVHGRQAIARFFTDRDWWGVAAAHLEPTRANGQPAHGLYLRPPGAPLASAHSLVVLTLDADGVAGITRFEPRLLARFGLPPTLD